MNIRNKGYIYSYPADSKFLPSTINIKNSRTITNSINIDNTLLDSIGCVIISPGYYTLSENIYFNPASPNKAAIVIMSDNVTLDFNQNSLTNISNSVYGVVVARNSNNVSIINTFKNLNNLKIDPCNKKIPYKNSNTNGTINDFLIAGIRVFGRTKYIRIQDIHINQNISQNLQNNILPIRNEDVIDAKLNYGISVGEGDSIGIDMLETNIQNGVNNLEIKNVFIGGSIIGVRLISTFNYEIINCDFINNSYYSLLTGSAFILSNNDSVFNNLCKFGNISNCRFVDNQGKNNNISRPDNNNFFKFFCCLGAYYVDSLIIKSCLFSNNNSDTNTSIIDVESSINIVIDGNIIGNSTATNEATLLSGINFSVKRGLLLNSVLERDFEFVTNENVEIKNTVIQKLFGTNVNLQGIIMSTINNCTIINCNIYDLKNKYNFASSNKTSVGFMITNISQIYYAQNINIIDSSAINIGLKKEFSDESSFYILDYAKNIKFENCHGSHSSSSLIIFDKTITNDSGAKNITVDNCKFINNNISILVRSTSVTSINQRFEGLNILNTNIYNSIIGILTGEIVPKLVIRNNIIISQFSIGIRLFSTQGYVSNNIVYTIVAYINVPAVNIVTSPVLSLSNNVVNLNVSLV